MYRIQHPVLLVVRGALRCHLEQGMLRWQKAVDLVGTDERARKKRDITTCYSPQNLAILEGICATVGSIIKIYLVMEYSQSLAARRSDNQEQ